MSTQDMESQAEQNTNNDTPITDPEEQKLYEETTIALRTPLSFEDLPERIALWDRTLAAWEQILRSPTVSAQANETYRLALAGAAAANFSRYQIAHKKKDLARAVELWEKAVKDAPVDTPALVTLLNLLGYALNEYYERTGDAAHIHKAVRALEQAVHLSSVGSEIWLNSLNSLGNVLRTLYGHTRKVADHDRAIQVYGQLVEHTDLDSPDLPQRLHNLCSGLIERYTRTHNIADLDRAIHGLEEMVERTTPESPYREMYLINFCNAASMRFVLTGEQADRERAFRVMKLVLLELPVGNPEWRDSFEHYVTLSLKHINSTKEVAEVDEAIQTMEQILAKTPRDYRDLPIMSNFLFVAYTTRSGLTNSDADDKHAMQLLEEALSIMKPDSFYRMQCLFNLGSSLHTNYSTSKNLDDLNRAINYLEQAVALLSPKTQHVRDVYLTTLASALMHRFQHTENMDDLERANTLRKMLKET